MKKPILLLCFTLITLVSTAQFGLKAGLNIANVGGDDAEDNKALIGWYLGAYYNAMIASSFSFQPELIWSAQGAKFDDGTDEAKLMLAYIQLTALLRYNAQSGFFIGTGPGLGFLTSAKVKADGEKVDVKDEFKGSNFLWAFALGFMGKSGWGAYARYDLGLSNILDDDESDLKTRVISLGLRWQFMRAAAASK